MSKMTIAAILINMMPIQALAADSVVSGQDGEASEIIIAVVDEDGGAVQADIRAYDNSGKEIDLGDAAPPPPTTLKTTLKCTDGVRLMAIPEARGIYFDSKKEACRPSITLHLIKRQTPKGIAQSAVVRVVSPDGPGGDQIWITSRVIMGIDANQTVSGVSGFPPKQQFRCSVTATPSIYTTVVKYAADGTKEGNSFNDFGALSGRPPLQADYADRCDTQKTSSHIEALSKSAANYIDQNWFKVVQSPAVEKSPYMDVINGSKAVEQFQLHNFGEQK